MAKALEERGLETDLIDLAKTPLPILGGPFEDDPQSKKNIDQVSSRLKTADALIFVTPDYHGSLSGMLKNGLII